MQPVVNNSCLRSTKSAAVWATFGDNINQKNPRTQMPSGATTHYVPGSLHDVSSKASSLRPLVFTTSAVGNANEFTEIAEKVSTLKQQQSTLIPTPNQQSFPLVKLSVTLSRVIRGG